MMFGFPPIAALMLAALSAANTPSAPAEDLPPEHTRTVRLIQDDAQPEMTSRVFELHHQKANDLVPFILGAAKRYSANSSVSRINYKAADQQLVSVSCPKIIMPMIAEMIQTLDRPSPRDAYGSGIRGTGIERNVYAPKYRNGARITAIMIAAGIPGDATNSAGQDAAVHFDEQTNLIYWKDSLKKSQDLTRYLGDLDRPPPQAQLTFELHMLREQDLQDIGLDYLAWKNGPGLDLLDFGLKLLEGSALEQTFGPYGFYAFTPVFDAAFIRLLARKGKTTVANCGSLRVSNAHPAELRFSPDYQAWVKTTPNFKSFLVESGESDFRLNLDQLIVIPGTPGKTVFDLTLSAREAVSQEGTLTAQDETHLFKSQCSLVNGAPRIIGEWTVQGTVTQTIGMPYLSEIPYAGSLFSTTTSNRETLRCYLLVQAETPPETVDSARNALQGKLQPWDALRLPETPTVSEVRQ